MRSAIEVLLSNPPKGEDLHSVESFPTVRALEEALLHMTACMACQVLNPSKFLLAFLTLESFCRGSWSPRSASVVRI